MSVDCFKADDKTIVMLSRARNGKASLRLTAPGEERIAVEVIMTPKEIARLMKAFVSLVTYSELD